MTGWQPHWRRKKAKPKTERYDGPAFIGQQVFVAGRASVVSGFAEDGRIQLSATDPQSTEADPPPKIADKGRWRR